MIRKGSNVISSIETWLEIAPPKRRELHWKDTRSAKELARAWFPTSGLLSIPAALRALVASAPTLKEFRLLEGTPELIVPIDAYGGESSNLDLLLVGITEAGKTVIGIEAKADEQFGAILGKAHSRSSADPRSNKPKRIDKLCRAIFGKPFAEAHELHSLRYQFFTGAAATLIEAARQEASVALFVIHEFVSTGLNKRNLARNKADFRAFVKALDATVVEPAEGLLYGPIQVPGFGRVPSHIPLYVGKASTAI